MELKPLRLPDEDGLWSLRGDMMVAKDGSIFDAPHLHFQLLSPPGRVVSSRTMRFRTDMRDPVGLAELREVHATINRDLTNQGLRPVTQIEILDVFENTWRHVLRQWLQSVAHTLHSSVSREEIARIWGQEEVQSIMDI